MASVTPCFEHSICLSFPPVMPHFSVSWYWLLRPSASEFFYKLIIFFSELLLKKENKKMLPARLWRPVFAARRRSLVHGTVTVATNVPERPGMFRNAAHSLTHPPRSMIQVATYCRMKVTTHSTISRISSSWLKERFSTWHHQIGSTRQWYSYMIVAVSLHKTRIHVV